MRFVPSIVLATVVAATGAVASPAATEIEPGLFMETFDFGQIDLDTSVSIGDETGSLAKRQHEQCWDNHLTTRQNQEAYEDDCDNLISDLENSPRTQLLQPLQTIVFRTNQSRCKVVVRNQSKCHAKIITNQSVGRAAKETLNECISLTQCSGWGYLGAAKDNPLVYIVEPLEVAPPTYSPRC
ncbi:hypothetical protein NQ176_g251 [Zarea fungicola]|uniref:Uncharacterized protein n=1 Tax=Zarea fungicola TaxID=93591 RepID=A0ACC1NYA2_9HYPO|nr:hypothetical protein NQ176_g251 [Lecanicillium fungicola]